MLFLHVEATLYFIVPLDIYKIVIVHGAGIKTNIVKLLETGKVEDRTDFVTTSHLSNDGKDTYNIIECDEVCILF